MLCSIFFVLTALLLIINLNNKAHASGPSYDASIFKGVNTLVISVWPAPLHKDVIFPVTQNELTDMVLDHFRKKLADQADSIKVVDLVTWRSTKHSDDEYNAALNLHFFISWRDVKGFGEAKKPDVAAVSVKIIRDKTSVAQPVGGVSSNYLSDVIAVPFLVPEDNIAFREVVLGAIDETSDWFSPWLICQKMHCGKGQSPYYK